MGGFGSGNREPRLKKQTINDSIAVALRDFQNGGFRSWAGTITWNCESWDGEQSICFLVTAGAAGPVVTLQYRWDDREDIGFAFPLQSTPTNFNGRRWWLTCPLIVDGVTCNRRVGKLYLPPGAKYFGCRHCYDLTYRSCQATRDRQFQPEAPACRR
jgi:hypothetical protein